MAGSDRTNRCIVGKRVSFPSSSQRKIATGCSLMLQIGWLAVCLFATAAFALDPEKAITQFVHTAWTEREGAPSDIRGIAQTRDGYLWLMSPSGLFHFDGVRFVRFEPRAGEDLPIGMRRLLATRDGSLWIVFASGNVSRLLNGHLTPYSEREGLPAAFALVESKDGSLIAGTAKGLARFKDGIWKDVTKEWNFPGKLAQRLYFDKAGTLWVLTEDKIVYLPSSQSRFVDPGQAVVGAVGNFAQAPDGTIWISEGGRSAHTVRRLEDHDPMTEVRVGSSRVLFDRDGSLWISSIGDGLRRIAHPDRISGHQIAQFGPEAEQFTAKDGLSGNYVNTLVEDREGNIWCGTGYGLDRFRKSIFTPISIPHSDIPRAIVATSDGGLWTFTINALEILRIGPRGDQKVMLNRITGWSMFEDESGVLWISSYYYAARFQRGQFVHITDSKHPLPGGVVLTAITGVVRDDEDGTWFLDADQGLFRLADGVLTKIADQREPVYRFGVLFKDRRGRIWVGQYNHVSLYDHGKFQVFGTGDGVQPGTVFTIYHDRAGNIWVGGEGGLSSFENGRFRALSKANGLPAQSVNGIAEDDDGYWWMATDAGVLRIPAGELDRAVANPAYRVRYESFNVLDGLPGKPRQIFPMPVVVRTTDGRIWFATTNGIAYVEPRRIPKNDLPPPVHIETVKIGDKQITPADGIILAHSTNDIEIDYTALSLSIPERVLFRYKLEGADTDWHDAGTRRQAFYNHLNHKQYRFRVIACNNDGVWNEAGASWDFRIAPMFYQTAWFQLLCVFAGAGLIWLLYRFRLRQMTARVDLRYAERLDERTRIARELHDTLLQSFHGLMFQFQAARNLLPRRPESAMQTLDEAIYATEQAIAEGRDAIHDLRPEPTIQHDLAELLTGAGQELASVQTVNGHIPSFRVIVEGKPQTLSPTLEDEIYRIGREVIRNAFHHAVASRIEVEIRYDEDQLRLRIRDDGKGIDPKVLEAASRPGHWGLPGIRERAQRIGSHLEFWSEAGAGTEVELRVPAAIAYEKQGRGRRFRLFRGGGRNGGRS